MISDVFKIGETYNNKINNEVISSWKGNVFLNGATGSGKSYFVLNKLVKYCETHMKSILVLCNRTALRKSYYEKKVNNNLHNITISSYQEIQENIKKGIKFREKYDFIVCDECHYFTTDSLYIIDTDLSFDWIINNNAIKIFMSGTGWTMFNYLYDKKLLDYCYTIPYDYSYVKDFIIYEKKENVYNIINDLLTNTNDKIIYFANSLNLALKVYNQFKKYSHFKCSKYIKDEKIQKLNEVGENECIKEKNNTITFDKRLLIATKALDNGIDLKDKNIKYIISDIYDMESAQQCLGRKRIIDKNDNVTFYIRNYNKNAVGGLYTQLQRKLKPIITFITNKKLFHDKYDIDRTFHSEYIYHIDENTRDYNHLAYIKLKEEAKKMKLILDEKNYYIDMFLDNFNNLKNIKSLELEEEYKMKDELQLYLESIVGKKLFKEEQEELINKINLTDSRGRQQKSARSINQYLNDNFNMTIITNRESIRKSINFRKTYWIINEGII